MLTRLRPRRFASYSAASARAYHLVLLSPGCQPATPIESVIRSMISGWPRSTSGRDAKLAQANGDPGRIVRACPWQQEAELVPAQTGDQAVAPYIGEKDLAYNAQDLVPRSCPWVSLTRLK